MFDIDRIVTTPLIMLPWRHQVITSFFDDYNFDVIRKGAERMLAAKLSKTYFGENGINLFEARSFIGDEAFNIISATNRTMLDNINRIYNLYPRHRRYEKLISIPTFHLIRNGDGNNAIHDEAIDKTCSIIVYISPNKSTGTLLYKEPNYESFVNEVEWNPNTAILFCAETGVTWHDFHNHDSGDRVTLNFFIEKDFSESIVENTDSFSYNILNGIITIPKNKESIAAARAIESGYYTTIV